MQEARIKQMIFDIPRQIEYCSILYAARARRRHSQRNAGWRRLRGATPPLWMKPGDVVEIEVERLGVLRNGRRRRNLIERRQPATA